MKIRLGYVAIALNLPKVTSSSQLTFKRYSGLLGEKKLSELKRITRSNLADLKKILEFNIENDIHFYRMTSRLIPLATHPSVVNWDFRKYFRVEFRLIGDLIKKYNMRVDTHPDHFNVLNSLRDEVVDKTIKEFMLHDNFYEDMKYKEGKMVIHVGSGQEGKDKSIERFIRNFKILPNEISKRIIIENDDKLFTSREVLNLCNKLKVPMVLDIHHHSCNSGDDKIEDILESFFRTWDGEYYCPKIHISSPKDGGTDRKHADYINPNEFINFIEKCKKYNRDIDVMIEAKQKDIALFKLVKDVKELKKEWKWIDRTTIEI